MTWKWYQDLKASGMQDVAVPVNSFDPFVALAGRNGTIWRRRGGTYTQDTRASGFRRVAMSPDGKWLYGIGANGTVWYSQTPEVWTQLAGTPAIGPVEDAVVNYDNSLWVCTSNGQMWSMRNGKDWESRTVLDGFKRLAVGPNNQWWGIDRAGLLFRRDGNADVEHDYWRDTKGSGFEDITVALDGTVWLVGSNGTVWRTQDGQAFTQTEASGFHSISAMASSIMWAVGTNGTLWTCENVPDPKPPIPPPPVPPIPPPPVALHLSVVDHSGGIYSITAASWRLWRQNPHLTELPPLPGPAVSTVLPGNGQYQLHADVWAKPVNQEQSELATFTGNGFSSDGVPTFGFVWPGASPTMQFQLVARDLDGRINPVVEAWPV